MQKILLVLMMCLTATAAANTVEVESDSNTYFRVENARVDADDAVKAYKAGKDVYKCTAVKGAVDSNGKAIAASKCKLQKRVLSSRTGNETWKAK